VKFRAEVTSAVKNPRTAAGVAILSIAGAFVLAAWSPSELNQAVDDAAAHGIVGFNTVAAMIASRSPGERPDGALASLKSKRQAAPHERALAKVRPAAPTLASIVAGPSTPPVVVVPPIAATPLFNTVVPTPIVPAATPIPGGPPGGFPAITPPGGGGLIVPPIVTPAVTPVTPVTPLPEPSSWAMMLIGLVLVGRIVGRKGAAASK
jgi:hypothetical protein